MLLSFHTHSRSRSQSVQRLGEVGKNLVGWHFGFKLHLVVNDQGELLAFNLTPVNTDNRQPVPKLT